jgi:hypothetical protein
VVDFRGPIVLRVLFRSRLLTRATRVHGYQRTVPAEHAPSGVEGFGVIIGGEAEQQQQMESGSLVLARITSQCGPW